MKQIKLLLFIGIASAAVVFFVSCLHEGSHVDLNKFNDIEDSEVVMKGKITVINVWATWCGTCIREIPSLNKLQERYKDDPQVQFIAMADEDAGTVRTALRRWPFNYRQVVNASRFTRQLKSGMVKTYPQNIILDAEGTVVFEQTDGSADIFSALNDKIEELKSK